MIYEARDLVHHIKMLQSDFLSMQASMQGKHSKQPNLILSLIPLNSLTQSFCTLWKSQFCTTSCPFLAISDIGFDQGHTLLPPASEL